MIDSDLLRLTGLLGIGFAVLTFASIPLYFIYSGPPPARNILARVLLNFIGLVVFAGFLVGFRQSLLQDRPALEFVATLGLVLGLIHIVLTFVADALQAGTVLGKSERLDPTLVGAGAEGALIIYGPISRLLEAVFLIAAGAGILASGLVPAWCAWLAFAVAVFQLAFLPSLFSTVDPARFYSVNGWGIPVAGGTFLLWVLVTSLALVLSA